MRCLYFEFSSVKVTIKINLVTAIFSKKMWYLKFSNYRNQKDKK